MKKSLLYFVPVLAIVALLTTSCEKEPVLSQIQATVDGYRVTFSVTAKNADSYLWNFGDDQNSTEAAPVHIYPGSGTYTVNLTVTGKGGESKASTIVEIPLTVNEMLSGGPAAENGKTWVLDGVYTEGMNGGGAVDNSMSIVLPSVEDMLTAIGLGGEYDNEFTFFSDGRYVVDVKNGIALTSSLYGLFTGTTVDYGNAGNNLGIYGATYTPPASATWTLHDEDLLVDAITNPLGVEVPAPHAVVTITGKKWVSLSGDAFFGILDFPTTRQFIIKEITPEKMYVAVFICGYFADQSAWSLPEYLFHLTYIPKK